MYLIGRRHLPEPKFTNPKPKLIPFKSSALLQKTFNKIQLKSNPSQIYLFVVYKVWSNVIFEKHVDSLTNIILQLETHI